MPVTDGKRHLVCWPYSVGALHEVADYFGIKRGWFHAPKRTFFSDRGFVLTGYAHYDIPKCRMGEISARCLLVKPRHIILIARGGSLSDAFRVEGGVGQGS